MYVVTKQLRRNIEILNMNLEIHPYIYIPSISPHKQARGDSGKENLPETSNGRTCLPLNLIV